MKLIPEDMWAKAKELGIQICDDSGDYVDSKGCHAETACGLEYLIKRNEQENELKPCPMPKCNGKPKLRCLDGDTVSCSECGFPHAGEECCISVEQWQDLPRCDGCREYNNLRSRIAELETIVELEAESETFRGLVTAELAKSREKFPRLHSPHECYAVILEELDEFWDCVRAWKGTIKAEALKELVQIAAMAQRAAEDLDLCSQEQTTTRL